MVLRLSVGMCFGQIMKWIHWAVPDEFEVAGRRPVSSSSKAVKKNESYDAAKRIVHRGRDIAPAIRPKVFMCISWCSGIQPQLSVRVESHN